MRNEALRWSFLGDSGSMEKAEHLSCKIRRGLSEICIKGDLRVMLMKD